MKKFENVVIASDIDGTFLARKPQGMARNRERIAYFLEHGGHFTLASGRTRIALLRAVPDIGSLSDVPCLACNGACLYDYAADREIARHPMSHEYVREFITYLESTGLPCGCRMVSGDIQLFYRLDYPMTCREYDNILQAGDEYRLLPVSEWADYPLYRMTIRAEDHVIAKILELCTERFRGKLSFAHSESTMLDVQDFHVNKAAVLQEMIGLCFDRPMFLCAVGDYGNDLEMLKIADLACCPENAIDSVKAICHKVVGHCDDGAIGDVIDYLDTMF